MKKKTKKIPLRSKSFAGQAPEKRINEATKRLERMDYGLLPYDHSQRLEILEDKILIAGVRLGLRWVRKANAPSAS